MKTKTTIYILIILLLLLLFSNYKLFVLNKHYKGLLPFLLEGERIKNVQLIDGNSQSIKPQFLKEGTAVIFVFMKGCSPCNKNIVFWNNITKLFENKVSAIGVVLSSPSEAFKFEEETNLNFKIYVPDNLKKYTEDMRMKLNQSQTIVLKGGRVKLVKMGDLDQSGMVEVIKSIKETLK